MIKRSLIFNTVRRKPNAKEEDYEDTGVDDLLASSTNVMKVTPSDGEYSSFPEIHKKTVEVLLKAGYVNLFPIQQCCFYPIYQREDVIARDLTGSGKTIAFGLPTVEYLRRNRFLGSRRV